MGELTLMQRAAFGELAAQRAMVDEALAYSLADGATPEIEREAYAWAEFWGRLTLAHGEQEDRRRFIGLLALRIGEANSRGDTVTASAFNAEAIALLDVLADEGADVAGDMLQDLVAISPPEHVAMAKEFLQMWGVE